MNRTLSLIILLTFTYSCSDFEIEPKSYPVVLMKSAEVASNQVTLTADLVDLGGESTTSYGFIWSNGNVIDSARLFQKELGTETNAGEFTFTITSDLIQGESYTVKPYVQNNSVLVLGNEVTFEGEGAQEPVIVDFNPKFGGIGTQVTITGEHFSLAASRLTVTFGEDEASILSNSENELVVQLPNDLSFSGEVPLSIQSGRQTAVAAQPFDIQGHFITGIEPQEGFIGETEITITGRDFLNSGNVVRIAGETMEVLEEQSTQIRIKLAKDMFTGEFPIIVEKQGQVTTSATTLLVKSRWSQLARFPSTGRGGSYFTEWEGKIYMICGGTAGTNVESPEFFNEVWAYDIATDVWEQKNDFPGAGRQEGIGFNFNGTIYFGMGGVQDLGANFNDFWSYDIANDQWTELNEIEFAPKRNGITFNINGDGYLIVEQDILKYDPEDDSWTFEGMPPSGGDFPNFWYHTSLANSGNGSSGLIKMPFGQIYAFDPTATEQFTLVGNGLASFSSVLFDFGDKLAMSRTNTTVEYHTFDKSTNTLTQIENFPTESFRGGSYLVHEGKGYVTMGFDNRTRSYREDFYVYDNTK